MYAQSRIHPQRYDGVDVGCSQSARRPSRYLIAISVHGEPTAPLPAITSQRPLWLCAGGACTPNEAAAVIRLGCDGEPTIAKTGTADVAIRRNGREYHLKPDIPVLLFKDDVVQIDGTDLEIVGLASLGSISARSTSDVHPSPAPSRHQILRVLCTIAAVFMLCSFGANAYAQESVEGKECFAESGSYLCRSNKRFECVDNRWKLVEACKKPSYCEEYTNEPDAGAYCRNAEPCTDGNYTCYFDNENRRYEIYQCVKGKWEYVKKCGDHQGCREVSNTEPVCVAPKRLGGVRRDPLPSKPQPEGTIDKSAVAKALKDADQKGKECGHDGDLVVQFDISGNKAKNVKVVDGTFKGDATVEKCITTIVKKQNWPDGGAMSVKYRFKF